MKNLSVLNKNKVDLLEIKNFYKIKEYTELYDLICKLIHDNKIIPIKSSKTNGMKPALFNKYFIVVDEKDYNEYINEIKYELNPLINTSYYLKHMDKYDEDRDYILKFSTFLDSNAEILNKHISKNERSFQIWQEEKFLSEGKGIKLLKNLGIDISYLNIYETSEPLAYYSLNKNEPQNILIVENKDTFYSIRKYLMENDNNKIFGQIISTVIYGSGKKIYKSFSDFELWGEPYFFNKQNHIFYFGDLDYEGIIIYEGIYEAFKDKLEIKLFTEAYKYMMDKTISNNLNLPMTKEMQNKNIKEIFLNNFNDKYKGIIWDILKLGKYIPQEIINMSDMEKYNAI